MHDDIHAKKIEPTEQQKKDGNLDPITDAPGSHPVGTAVGSAVGGAAGIAAGVAASAATGMATGTVMGGPAGALVGLVAGAVVGGLAGKAIGEQIDPTMEDAFWREHHTKQPYYREGETHTFDAYSPAYRVGYMGRTRHEGKSFEEVEGDLRKEYEGSKADSNMTWENAKTAVRAAWDRVTAKFESHKK